MKDYWKATKRAFVWAIAFMIINLALFYMAYPLLHTQDSFDFSVNLPLIILSSFLFLLAINFGMKSLNLGEKKQSIL